MKKSLSTTVSVYNAGGGPGRRNIEFDTLAEGQSRMYERTLNQLSDFQIEFLAQEKRQITVVDIPVTINVNIAREDFPDITARIEITFVPSASQQAWEKFIKDTCKRLKVDFIYCILDRVDRSPVHRILRLRDNGDYLARQRETSAILEVINTGRTPMEVSWDITMDINDVKQSLALDERNQPVIDRRIASLVSKPVTRETQRDISTLLLNAVSPKVAVGIMEQFHRQYKLSVAGAGGEEDQPTAGGNWTGTGTEPSDVNWGDTARYGDAIDIVSLHRLCLETLARFAIKGRAKNIAASPCFDYVCGVIDGLRHEVDVVAMGLKLLSDVMKYLVEERERTYHVILDCVQAYAPPAPKHRPRNPKRLRAAEDLYGESMAGLGLSGGGTGGGFSIGAVGSPAGAVGAGVGRPPGGNMNMGGSGAAGAYGQSVSNQQQQSVEQGGGKGTAPATGAADIHPSLKRYGDFYGHSPAPQPGAVLEFSQSINLTKLYEHKNTDAHNRWQSREHASPRKETVVPVSTTVVDTPKTPEVGPRGPPDPDSVKALVRGRVRVDHQAATNALQSAFHPTAAASGGGAHASSSSVGSALVTAPSGSAGASTVAASTKEKVPAQDSAEFLQQQKEFREKKKRVPKYQFKFKLKGAKEEGGGFSSDGGGDTGDETEKKSQWKGTVGVIGRKAPEKVKEVVIDFKKKIVYDSTKDSGEHTDSEAPDAAATATAPAVPKTEEELAIEAAEAADKEAVAEALRATSAAAGKRKKKRHHKLALVPLPLVPCVVFRGLSGRSKQNLAMMQSFATLYKMVSQNYGNRDVAFKMGVAEEISVVVTVCQGMPRVLDYYIWIVDALYRDGFGELNADELDIALEDYTMVLSTSAGAPTAGNDTATVMGTAAGTATAGVRSTSNGPPRASTGRNGEDGKSMTGFMFDTISEMTVPSIDQDGLMSEATPVVNMGEPLPEGTVAPDAGKRSRRSSTAVVGGEGGSQVGTEDAIDDNPVVPSNQIKKAANQLLVNVLGLFEFEARYVQRPADDIVMGAAMISMHTELDNRERAMAQRWLDTWDDNSRGYKTLRKKGMDLAGMS